MSAREKAVSREIKKAAGDVLKAHQKLESAKEAASIVVADAVKAWAPGSYHVRCAGVRFGVRVHADRKAPSVSFVRVPRASQVINLDK